MKIKHIIISLLMLLTLGNNLSAQNTNTLYFMDNVAERSNMNPAFIPNCKFYLDFILLPNLYFNVGTNNLTFNDLIYTQNGIATTAFHSKKSINKFYNSLHPTTDIKLNLGLNLLSFGFRVKQHYFTFDVGLNADTYVYLPKDMFKLALYGTPNANGVNSYDLSSLGIEASLYSRIGFGYMNKINDQWQIGFKVKALMGYANIDTRINSLQLDASRHAWNLKTDGNIHATLPMTFASNEDGGIDFSSAQLYNTNDLISLLYKPSGYGGSVDFGISYEPIPYLTISTSITDLGFIYWSKGAISGNMKGKHQIDELVNYTLGDTVPIGNQISETFQNLGEDILGTIHTNNYNNAYMTMMRANFYAGIEYGVLHNAISFGLVNRLTFNNRRYQDEVTLALNLRPANWLKATIDYSFLNGRWGNLGLGLNLRMGIFNMYLLADYIPISFTRLHTETTKIPIPNRTQCFNLQVGWTWNIGNDKLDPDHDGVKGRKDKCPDTNLDFIRTQCPDLKKKKDFVDKNGCYHDKDSDGIHDCYDKCPNTPTGIPVNSEGCPIDSDNDGVYDYIDICPETPKDVVVDTLGCPVDTDMDGIVDYLDMCPETPKNVIIDSVGCPIDTDKDGVADYLDICPNTPKDIEVDEQGCPIDSDEDGIADYIDLCPNSPKGVIVDDNGCPLDKDKDGINDYVDKCPDTPINVAVDSLGCPIDSDKDGIYDYLDKCPNTPLGVAIDFEGCPIDSDKDGVPDYLDKCPETPSNAIIDSLGCPTDSDKDGIFDYLDNCPNNPLGVAVDSLGCPFDEDKDGVPDYIDKCPDTQKDMPVNEYGCPLDSDNDGILDIEDKCPHHPGLIYNHGCPEIKKEVRNLFKKAMTGIQFETGKAIIKKSSYPILDQIVAIMELNPEYHLTINGHTDSSGDDNDNMQLSIERASAVGLYFIHKGIDFKRLTTNGYGETQPISDNNTSKGRERNRRVEFEISFEDVTYETITNPELQNIENPINE